MPDLFDLAYDGDVEALSSRLSAGTDVNEGNSDGWTALHGACWGGHEDVLDLLLSHIPDLDLDRRSHVNGYTALLLACDNGHTSCVERILQAGADAGLGNDRGSTPLHHAASGEVVQLLLGHAGDLGVRGWRGQTPVHTACRWNRLSAVQVMLEHQADVNARDDRGITPLMWAVTQTSWAEEDVVPVVKLLCQHQADLAVQDDAGRDVLCVAEERSLTQIVDFLKGRHR